MGISLPKFCKLTICLLLALIIHISISLVPVPYVTINAPNIQTVSESLTLKCNVTLVRGITIRVDIAWSSNNVELKKLQEINTSLTSINTELFEDSYKIPLLSTSVDGRVFYCKVIIMTVPPIMAVNNVTIDVTGKWHKLLSLLGISHSVVILILHWYKPIVCNINNSNWSFCEQYSYVLTH